MWPNAIACRPLVQAARDLRPSDRRGSARNRPRPAYLSIDEAGMVAPVIAESDEAGLREIVAGAGGREVICEASASRSVSMSRVTAGPNRWSPSQCWLLLKMRNSRTSCSLSMARWSRRKIEPKRSSTCHALQRCGETPRSLARGRRLRGASRSRASTSLRQPHPRRASPPVARTRHARPGPTTLTGRMWQVLPCTMAGHGDATQRGCQGRPEVARSRELRSGSCRSSCKAPGRDLLPHLVRVC